MAPAGYRPRAANEPPIISLTPTNQTRNFIFEGRDAGAEEAACEEERQHPTAARTAAQEIKEKRGFESQTSLARQKHRPFKRKNKGNERSVWRSALIPGR
jgi:hypothetical protein